MTTQKKSGVVAGAVWGRYDHRGIERAIMKPLIPEQLRRAVERYAPERAILFGSAARGDADALSDFDLVLIKKTSQPFLERLVDFARLLPPTLARVDAFIYTPEEFSEMRERGNPIALAALSEGRTIYEAPTGRA